MKILSAKVIQLRCSPDYVYLHTDLPGAFPQYAGQNLTLKFEAPIDFGIKYVKEHFGLDAEIVKDSD